MLATIIICCVVFSIIITIVFFFKKKKQPINTENYGEGDDDKKNDIETEQNNQRTPGAAVAPIAINKKNGKDISLSNWSIPSEILEDKDLFIEWFLKSYRVALDKKIGKKVEY